MVDPGWKAGRTDTDAVDDHEFFRIVLSSILLSQVYAHVLEAGSVEDAMQVLDGNADNDSLTLDLRLPGFKDFGLIGVLREAYPALAVTAVSGSTSWNDAIECVRARAREEEAAFDVALKKIAKLGALRDPIRFTLTPVSFSVA